MGLTLVYIGKPHTQIYFDIGQNLLALISLTGRVDVKDIIQKNNYPFYTIFRVVIRTNFRQTNNVVTVRLPKEVTELI